MSSETYPLKTATVGAKIVEWHSCIIARSLEQAVLLKKECSELIKHMEPSDKILSYYSLVEFRHELLLNRKVELTDQLDQFDKDSEPFTPLLNYLYYFVSGQNEFLNERYQSAIRLFSKAERLLEHVNDDSEEADFYYYIGYTCYHLNQYPFACSYIDQARLIFDRLNYSDKSISCEVILGGIYSETKQHEKAIEAFKNAQSHAKTEEANGLIHQAFAIAYNRKEQYVDAIHHLDLALTFSKHKDSYHGMRSLCILANTLFRASMDDRAKEIFVAAEAAAITYKSVEYQARCKATKGLYLANDTTLVDQAIELLYEQSLEFERSEVSEEAAKFLWNKGETKKAWNYLNKAYDARLNQNSMGVNQS